MTQELMDNAVFAELNDTMGADFTAELVATFLSDAPNMFAALEKAVTDKDVDAYRRAAHSIKSNAQIFGAHVLADQARDMELAGLADSTAPVTALHVTYEQTAAALKDLSDE